MQERRAADGTILAVERAIPYEPMYIILSEYKCGEKVCDKVWR